MKGDAPCMNGIRRFSAFPCTGVNRVSRTTDILTCRDEGLSWWTARLMGGEVKLMGGEAKLTGGEAELMGGERTSRLPGRNDVHINSILGGFRNSHRFTLLLKCLQEIRIEVSVFLNGFPGEDFVVTWRDAANDEMTLWVRDRVSVAIKPVAKPIGNHDNLNAGNRLRLFIEHRSVDLAGVRADHDLQRPRRCIR